MRALKWFVLVAFIALIFLSPTVKAEEDDDDVGTVETNLKGAKVPLKTDDEVINREEQAMSRDGYSVEEQKLMKTQTENFQFQTEVNRMMSIIINSLYSNKEIFLRELISNSSDALDKIRFLSLTNPALLGEGDQAKLDIKIQLDKDAQTLTITDKGIGMTKAELIKNLGTIAQSGTKEFLQKFEQGSTSNLIGQFGVGFYSAFLVSDHVTVVSKHNDDDQYIWTSKADDGSFSIVKDPHGNTLGRGTRITLHLKSEAFEFLEENNVRNLAKKYSEFISFPIYLWASRSETKETPVQGDDEAEIPKGEEGIAVEEEEEGDEEPKTVTVTETIWDWELLNHTKPIWTRSPKEITVQEYENFYRAITKEGEAPMKYIHFAAEGDVEFKSILYIPGSAPQNMFDPNADVHRGSIKLYVRRVFITDDFDGLMPSYLKFIRGVVDSDDLPLNVSREILQQNKLLNVIEKKLVRKSIAMFQDMANEEDKDTYKKFWKNYGTNVKLGVIEDVANRTRLTKLLMFLSSKDGDFTTIDDYVSRMKEGQDQIFYLAGSTKDAVEKSPLIERAIKKGYEVLYMVDPIDEYTLQHITKYDNKYKMTNLGKEGVKFDEEANEEEVKKQVEEEYKPLVDYLKDILTDKLDKVVVTDRLTTSPCALVSSLYGYTANMERIIKAQALGNRKENPYTPKKIMEINPYHPIIKELLRRVSTDKDDENAKITAAVLYETAVLSSGYTIDDPSQFAGWIHKMMSLNLQIDPSLIEEEPTTKTTTETKEGKDEL